LGENAQEFNRRQKPSNPMKKQFSVYLYLGSFLAVSIGHAGDLKQSKFTQVVNDVRVISMANNVEKPAAVNDIFNMPDFVRTGEASRAELVAADDTITRVGANTIFSFDPANRTIDLKQGSLLFHSPKGKGGGTIRTGSATASVLGTTIIVTTTRSGGFKVIDLEGHVAIKFLNGLRQSLNPGQMTFVLPGGHPAPIINIRLDQLTSNSKLVQGFAVPLPSMPLIQQQIADQIKLIQSGQAQDTGLLVGDVATTTSVQVVNANTIQSSDEATATPAGPGTINSSTLPVAFIVSSPFTAGPFTFPFGFSAPNITIGTPTIDLSSYKNVAEFAFVAPNGTLTINRSVTFDGLSATAILDLYANRFSIASGSTVEADVGTFNLYPQTATTLNKVAIVDDAGGALPAVSIIRADTSSSPTSSTGINIISPAAFSLTNGSSISAPNLLVSLDVGSVSINDSTVQGSSVDIFGATGVSTANHSTLTATGGDLFVFTGTGDVDLSATTIKASAANTSLDGSMLFYGINGMANLTNGTAITAAGTLLVGGDTGVTIADSSLTAGNGIDISSGGAVSVTGSATTTGYTTTFSGTTQIIADTSLNVNGATFSADTTSGTVTLSAPSGSNTLQNASVTASALTLNSGTLSDSGSITLNNASINVGTLSLTSGIATGSISVQNSSITTSTPLTLTAGATSGTVTVDNSSAQSGATTLSGATGVSIQNGSTVKSTFGDLKLTTTGGSITIDSSSTLQASPGAPVGEGAPPGDVNITAAGGTANVMGGATLTAVGTQNAVRITSDTGVSISGASTLNSGSRSYLTTSNGGISVTGNSTLNGGANLDSATDVTVNGATFNASPASGLVNLYATTGAVTVQNASITGNSVELQSPSATGSITVQASSITTSNLYLNSGDGILLDGAGGLNGGGTGTATLTAPANFNNPNCALTVSNADFSTYSTVNMAGYTVYLTNVIFSGTSTVNITSRNGGSSFPATQSAATPGDVNFIGNNNKYGTTPINAGTISTLSNIHLSSTT
jgi:ferric-dicitrate binding protein FerR (iron transport regulator)